MMEAFLQFMRDAFTMPTTVFSVLLILVLVYWTLSLIGLADLGMLEGLADMTDAAEAVELEGGPGFFGNVGFGDVPRSISWSLVILFGWIISYLGSTYIPQFREIAVRGLWFTAGAIVLTLALGLGLTAIAIQPVRKLTTTQSGTVRQDLVGRVCTVKTLRVDESFGQAEVDQGNMLIQVRSATPNDLAYGTKALIYEYDERHEVFRVAPYQETQQPVSRT